MGGIYRLLAASVVAAAALVAHFLLAGLRVDATGGSAPSLPHRLGTSAPNEPPPPSRTDYRLDIAAAAKADIATQAISLVGGR